MPSPLWVEGERDGEAILSPRGEEEGMGTQEERRERQRKIKFTKGVWIKV